MPGMTFTSGNHPFGDLAMHIYITVGLFIGAGILLLILIYLCAEKTQGETTENNTQPATSTNETSVNRRIKYLTRSFGVLWTLDGILQLRDAMPSQFVSSIINPSFALAPPPIREIAKLAGAIWTTNPVKLDIGAAFIQIVIGLGMFTLKPDIALTYILKLSIVWSAIIFAVGNGFGILYQGASVTTGAPSAILIYLFASTEILKLQRERSLSKSRRRTSKFLSAYLMTGVVLTLLPAEGFWKPNGYSEMISAMAQSKQPEILNKLLHAVAALVTNHGEILNAGMLIAYSAIAIAVTLNRRSNIGAAIALITVSAISWALIQDFGIFSPTGTDFNSGLPAILLTITLISRNPNSNSQSKEIGQPMEDQHLMNAWISR